ncbi:MAG: discoidin domain-containing protein [Lentisphaerales bacterium]|nr:discoidin domain-containing protein [Lentisphaerales bacterium]
MKYIFLFLVIVNSLWLSAGGLDREVYHDISGNSVNSLTYDNRFRISPDYTDVVTDYESPQNYGKNFGVLLRGYITVPETADYIFYFSSDDYGELYLSSDELAENKQKIAYVNGWSGFREFDKYDSQKSITISLIEGQVLYTEAMYKEGGGLDHLSVAWSIDGAEIEVITSEHLTPYFENVEQFKGELSATISDAQNFYDLSENEKGILPGQYSDAMRVNFSREIDKAQQIFNDQNADGRQFSIANNSLIKAIDFFTGGIKPITLKGDIFGGEPSYSESRKAEAAFDENPSTFYQYFAADEGYVGIDLGHGSETALTGFRFRPQINKLNRIKNNKIQGSLDGESYTDLYTFPDEGIDDWNYVELTDTTAYRYYRYYDVPGSSDWGIIAELQFIGFTKQEIYMQKHEAFVFSVNTEKQLISSASLTANHGGLLPELITYKILNLPANGSLYLNDVELLIESTFTQEDLNQNLIAYSSDDSHKSDEFIVEVSSSIGGLLPEVTVEIFIDTDRDGLSDEQEIALGTDWNKPDSDGDGSSDFWEQQNGFNPLENIIAEQIEAFNGENGLNASYWYASPTSLAAFPVDAGPAEVNKVSSLNFTSSRSYAVGSSQKNYGTFVFSGGKVISYRPLSIDISA